MSTWADLWQTLSGGLQAEREEAARQRQALQGTIDTLTAEYQRDEAALLTTQAALRDCQARLQAVSASPGPVPGIPQAFVAGAVEKAAAWVVNTLYYPLLNQHGGQFRVLDGIYWLLPLDRFKAEILEPWRTMRYQVDGDRFDCDDFSLSFAAYSRARGINAVSIVIASGAAHGFNIVALPDGRLLGIEPQGGEWVTEFTGLYSLSLSLVLI